MRMPLAAVLLALAAPATAQTDQELERGRTLMRWVFEARADSLLPEMAPEFVQALGGPGALEGMGASLTAQLGREGKVVEEAVYREAGHVSYYRIAKFAKLGERTATVRWVWRDTDGKVVGATVNPTPVPALTDHADYVTKTPLMLPFEGEWYVAWGGSAPHQNYHVIAPDQRFAYDMLVMSDGATFSGDRTRNESYHCFGQPVFAPGAGRVVVSVDSVADNVPGQMNRTAPPGNHVVIDHGNGEYSLLAHFRRGSVQVHAGDAVTQGQRIAECGNSGNSSEAHLHYHMQTGAAFGDGVGLPAQFLDYVANGQRVERGVPVRGETIRRRN